jgi:polyhydroxybutyrate depolymerase
MRRYDRRAWLAVAGLTVAAACSRADLDAITRPPATDGGADSGPPVTCPSPALPPGDMMETLEVNGVSRRYLLHVPPIYDGSKPVPLLVDFHALNSTGPQQFGISPYPAQTDPEGAVMAFPTGLAGPSGGAAWDVGPCCLADVDDVAFVRALVAKVSTTACIDPKRVYAAGVYIGGGLAQYLACHAADVFAAVASSSFDLMEETVGGCQPARPITVINFRGTADPLVPYAGGPSAVVPGMPVTFLGAQGTFQKWAEIDQCTGPASAQDGNGCSTNSNCAGGVEVMLCTMQGGGQDASNGSIAWPILKRHPLP